MNHPVHMNGRIYDPKLGRMLQADPFIQSPTNSQSLNRYNYVLNNPLSYTDPSGYFSLKSVLKFSMKVSGSWTTHKCLNKVPWLNNAISAGLNWVPYCQVWCSAVFNAQSSFVATGSLNAAFKAGGISAASGYVFQGIADSGLNPTQQVIAAGIAGGVISELQGGKFGNGFLAASVGYGMGSLTGGEATFEKFAAATIAGGTVSELTGGKFANGAMTAALSYAVATGASSGNSRDVTNVSASEMTDAEFAAVFGASDKWIAGEWVGSSTRTFKVMVNGHHRINWLGVGNEDWTSTGLDVLATRVRIRGLVPDLQYAREIGIYEQLYQSYEVPVQWWSNKNGGFNSVDTGTPYPTGTFWRAPIPTQVTTYSRMRWRVCYWSSCPGGS